MPPFDPTVRLGDLITLGVILVAGVTALVSLRKDLGAFGHSLKAVWTELGELRKVVVNQARAEERLNAHEKRLDALEK